METAFGFRNHCTSLNSHAAEDINVCTGYSTLSDPDTTILSLDLVVAVRTALNSSADEPRKHIPSTTNIIPPPGPYCQTQNPNRHGQHARCQTIYICPPTRIDTIYGGRARFRTPWPCAIRKKKFGPRDMNSHFPDHKNILNLSYQTVRQSRPLFS